MRGTVLFFNKTYGFIRADNNELEEDIFFRYKDIITETSFKQASQGDIVEFEIELEKERLKAKDVKIMEEIINGKKVIRVCIYPIKDNTFPLFSFYEQVISKTAVGLKHAFIFNDKIIATSEKIDKNMAMDIINNKNDDYIFKFI